jgi:hypothetical protein
MKSALHSRRSRSHVHTSSTSSIHTVEVVEELGRRGPGIEIGAPDDRERERDDGCSMKRRAEDRAVVNARW